MSDCDRLSDRMPAVALGRAGWTAEEARHLSWCQSCQQEWELLRLSHQLGREFGSSLDSETMAEAALRRIKQAREEEGGRRRAWRVAALAGAAAVVVAVWGAWEKPRASVPFTAPAVAALQYPLPELDNLQPLELNAVLQTMDQPYAGDSVGGPGSSDLDNEELDAVLDTWEG